MKLCKNLSISLRYRTNIRISDPNDILTAMFFPRHDTFISNNNILMDLTCYDWANIFVELKCSLGIESELFIIFAPQVDTLVDQWDVEGKIRIGWDCFYVFIEILIACACFILCWAPCYFYFIPEELLCIESSSDCEIWANLRAQALTYWKYFCHSSWFLVEIKMLLCAHFHLDFSCWKIFQPEILVFLFNKFHIEDPGSLTQIQIPDP